MKIRHAWKILPIVAVTVFAVALSGLPAGADPAPTAFVTLSAAGVVPAVTGVPNSNIVKNRSAAGTYRFKPSTLRARWDGPPPVGTCTSAIEKITITNRSAKTQTLTDKSGTVGTLPAHVSVGLCFWGTGKLVFRFGIEGQKAMLKVHLR